MNLSSPIRSVIPSAHGQVLAVLARTDQALSGRGVAELLNGRVSQRRVADVLADLVRAGIVNCDPGRPANRYWLNRRHVAAEAVTALAGMREAVFDRIAGLVAGWAIAPAALWAFGSAARGDGDVGSDVDLFVLRFDGVDEDDPVWVAQITALVEEVTAWTGNSAQELEYFESEFAALVAAKDPLVASLRRDAIRLAGDDVLSRCLPAVRV